VTRAVVEDVEDGVEPEAIHVVVADPELGVLDRPLAHAVARVVERAAPGRVVAIREVGAERAQKLLAAGPDVVVDHVEQYREPLGVRGVDQPGQALGPPVGPVRRREEHAVVAPAALAGEGGHGHELDRVHAELAKLAQVRDGAGERALVAEGAHVQLVEHQVGGRRWPPAAVAPPEPPGVEHARGPAQALGLPPRQGIGAAFAVHHEQVVVAVPGVGVRLPDVSVATVEVDDAPAERYRDRAGGRCPHTEGRATRRAGQRPESG
jgi:hypothetical protein